MEWSYLNRIQDQSNIIDSTTSGSGSSFSSQFAEQPEDDGNWSSSLSSLALSNSSKRSALILFLKLEASWGWNHLLPNYQNKKAERNSSDKWSKILMACEVLGVFGCQTMFRSFARILSGASLINLSM